MSFHDHRSPFAQTRWIEAYNAGSQEIPPWGVVEHTDFRAPGDGRMILDVKRPTADGLTAVAANSSHPIGPGKYGLVTMDWPALVAYNTGSTPAAGQSWGTAEDSFLLSKGKLGFEIIGSAIDDDLANRVGVKRVPVTGIWCQFTLSAALALTDASKGATIDFASGCDLTGSITVYNMDESGGSYVFKGDSGDYGKAEYRPEDQRWYIYQMECP